MVATKTIQEMLEYYKTLKLDFDPSPLENEYIFELEKDGYELIAVVSYNPRYIVDMPATYLDPEEGHWIYEDVTVTELGLDFEGEAVPLGELENEFYMVIESKL